MSEKIPHIEQPKYDINEITPDNKELLFEFRKQTDSKKTTEQLVAEAEKYANSPGMKALIAQEGGKAIGMVQVVLDDAQLPEGAPELKDIQDLAHLSRIGVLDDYQGRRIGTQLLERAEEYAKSNGKKGVWLDYRADNKKAERLYMSGGYKDVSKFKDGKKDRFRRVTVKYFIRPNFS